MKKITTMIALLFLSIICFTFKSYAATKYVYSWETPKYPSTPPAVKAAMNKYKKGDATGALQDLEIYINQAEKKKQNCDVAKYYLAYIYKQLNMTAESQKAAETFINADDNSILSLYSKTLVACSGGEATTECQSARAKITTQKAQSNQQVNSEVYNSDIAKFIRSNQKIHPSAMDKITNERMIRKIQEDEYKAKNL